MIDVVFVHGWSFDSRLWNTIVPLLRGIRPHVVDMGFTGNIDNTADALPDNAVLIGHSFGVQWLLNNLPDAPLALISIAGFDCFHKHKDARDIRAMKMALRRDPAALQRSFYAQCGAEDLLSGAGIPDTARLLAGLEALARADAGDALRALSCPVMALAARHDPIVPADMSKAIWPQDRLRWVDTAAHALPHTHAAWCAMHIQEAIDGCHI